MSEGNTTGISSTGLFGTLNVAQDQTIDLVSITSSESFGVAKLSYVIFSNAIPSANTFGVTKLNFHLDTLGIESLESFGQSQLNLYISPSGVVSTEVVNNPELDITYRITVNAIDSQEAIGQAQLNLGLYVTGIVSTSQLGSTLVIIEQFVSPQAIPTGLVFGTTKLNRTISVSGIATQETLGDPNIVYVIGVSSVGSGEAFGVAKATLNTIEIGQLPVPVSWVINTGVEDLVLDFSGTLTLKIRRSTNTVSITAKNDGEVRLDNSGMYIDRGRNQLGQ